MDGIFFFKSVSNDVDKTKLISNTGRQVTE